MDYHASNKSQVDVIRIPIDGSIFRDMEEKRLHFKEEPRNIMISLVENGVNLFAYMRSVYSEWPMFVINNNIPPWMSIKREHIMLAMIVPGICLCNNFFNAITSHFSYLLHNAKYFFSFTHIYYLFI